MGLIAIVAIVLLRITVGWHFFYEGVWKTEPKNNFSAIPFLAMAKGPVAPLFYDMLPDMNGKTRLQVKEKEEVTLADMLDPETAAKRSKGPNKDTVLYFPTYEDAWLKYYEGFKVKYDLGVEKNAETLKKADQLLARYRWSSYDYASEIQKNVEGYFESYTRYEKRIAEHANGAEHQKKRDWDDMLSFRKDVNNWAGHLTKLGDEFKAQLWNLLSPEQKAKGELPPIVYGKNNIIVTAPSLGVNSWVDFLNFGVTWALTAIGFCLLTGLCSRLAALGGAAFLVSVLMTQPTWPSIYPPFNAEVGHSMIVDKNFVEMVACIAIAAFPAGRWGGLDFFLWYCLGGKKIAAYFARKTEKQPVDDKK